MDDILQSSYYHFLLVYGDVGWFVEEVKNKLGSKMNFYYFKNTKKGIIMTEEDEEDSIDKEIVDFVKKFLSLIMLHRSKIISFHLCFINIKTTIVVCS